MTEPPYPEEAVRRWVKGSAIMVAALLALHGHLHPHLHAHRRSHATQA